MKRWWRECSERYIFQRWAGKRWGWETIETFRRVPSERAMGRIRRDEVSRGTTKIRVVKRTDTVVHESKIGGRA
jgi:hypothetical protein